MFDAGFLDAGFFDAGLWDANVGDAGLLDANGFDIEDAGDELDAAVRQIARQLGVSDDTKGVVVLAVDPERERISLGLKQLTPYPWEKVGEKYRCAICGNEVTVTKVGGGVLVCCGEEMKKVG